MTTAAGDGDFGPEDLAHGACQRSLLRESTVMIAAAAGLALPARQGPRRPGETLEARVTLGGTPLWAHQELAVKAAATVVAAGGRCKIIMACGTGKTIVGAVLSLEVAGDGKVLVIVPTLELLAQTARAWADALGEGAGLLGAVCSQAAATTEAAELRQELGHLDAGVSTDPAEVARWLGAAGRVTVLATYASLESVVEASRLASAQWDLLVVDEAHRSAGIAGSAWGLVHDDGRIPAARRAYLTATPRVMESAKHDVVSMDDEAVFGAEAYLLSFADAIAAGYLADYRVAVIAVTDEEIARLAMSPYDVVSVGGPAVPAGMLAAQVALLKACARWDLRRVITYHSRVHRARRFALTLANAADLLPAGQKPRLLHADHVEGSMRLSQRRDVLRRLKDPGGHTVVIANARVLSEGVDVPELDAIMLADPRESVIDVVQAVGRALRRGAREGKVATIIVPVVLSEDESPEAALEGSAFSSVWRVVQALRAHDERLADWLDAGRIAGLGRPHGADDHVLPDWLDVSGIPATGAFARALEVRLVESATSSWLEGYGHAAAWAAEHGHLLVPQSHVTPGGYPLGRWVNYTRGQRAAGALDRRRIAMLDEIGMAWVARGGDEGWERGITALREFTRAHGHCTVPRGYRAADGLYLGSWVQWRRSDHAAGTLPAERAAALEALGLAWEPGQIKWEDGLADCRDYLAAHGNLDMGTQQKGRRVVNLGQWIARQREAHAAGTLPPERAAALEALGIQWAAKRGRCQDAMIAAVRAYHAAHGSAEVPAAYVTADGLRLGTWLYNKKQQLASGHAILPGALAVLRDLGVPWAMEGQRPPGRSAPSRDEMGAALRAWHAEHGHVRVPEDHVTADGLALGVWLANKKRSVRRGGRNHPQTDSLLRELGADWLPPG